MVLGQPLDERGASPAQGWRSSRLSEGPTCGLDRGGRRPDRVEARREVEQGGVPQAKPATEARGVAAVMDGEVHEGEALAASVGRDRVSMIKGPPGARPASGSRPPSIALERRPEGLDEVGIEEPIAEFEGPGREHPLPLGDGAGHLAEDHFEREVGRADRQEGAVKFARPGPSRSLRCGTGSGRRPIDRSRGRQCGRGPAGRGRGCRRCESSSSTAAPSRA